MSRNHIVLSIGRLCREAGLTINSYMRVSSLSATTLHRWRQQPEKMSDDSIRAMYDGAGRVIGAMRELQSTLADALPADDARRQ